MSLIIAGQTTNFIVQYENTLPNQANVIANANALLPVLETEFTVTTGWFNTPGGKFGAGQKQVVNLNLPDTSTGGGASTSRERTTAVMAARSTSTPRTCSPARPPPNASRTCSWPSGPRS